MTATGLMAAPFPEPPGVIARLLDELRIAAAATDETEHESRRVAMLSRPWDPPSCPARDPAERLPVARRGRRVDQRGPHLAYRSRGPDLLGSAPAPRPRARDPDLPALGGDLRAYASRSGGVAPLHAARIPRPRGRPDRGDRLSTGAAPAQPGRGPKCDLSRGRRVCAAPKHTLARSRGPPSGSDHVNLNRSLTLLPTKLKSERLSCRNGLGSMWILGVLRKDILDDQKSPTVTP